MKSLIYRNVSPLTYRGYSHYLNRYLRFCTDIEVSEINEINLGKYRNHLSGYIDPNTGLTLKRVTQNYLLIALRRLIEFARKKGLTELTKESVPLIQTKQEDRSPVEKRDLDQVLNIPDVHTKAGLRDKAVLEVLLSSGLLVSELSSLNRHQINFEKKEITLIGKGSRKRTVYIFDRCSYWLEKYLSTRSDSFKPLFIRFQGKKTFYDEGERMRLTPRTIERIVEKYARASSLAGKITPQTFRQYLAMNLLKKKVDSGAICSFLGLESKFSLYQYQKQFERSHES